MTANPTSFPQMITASTWSGCVQVMREAASKRNGTTGVQAPLLTNADAIALIRAWRGVIGTWPLWYQFAAVAYGWNPATDKLDTSTAQQKRMFADGDRYLTAELWTAIADIAGMLDDAKDGDKPRLDVDVDAFADPVMQGAVRSALLGDGARAQFKIPLPACKRKDGSMGKPERGADGRWRCDPVTVDDPITHIKGSLGPLVLMLGMLWLLSGTDSRR